MRTQTTRFPTRSLLAVAVGACVGSAMWTGICAASGAFGPTDAMYEAVVTTSLIAGGVGGFMGALVAILMRRGEAGSKSKATPDLPQVLLDPVPSLPALAPFMVSLMGKDSLERVLVAVAIGADEAGYYFSRHVRHGTARPLPAEVLADIGCKAMEAQKASCGARVSEAELRLQLAVAVRNGDAAKAGANIMEALAQLGVFPVQFASSLASPVAQPAATRPVGRGASPVIVAPVGADELHALQ